MSLSPAAARSRRGKLTAYVELLHLPPIGMVLLGVTGSMAAAAQGWPPFDRLGLLLLSFLLTQFAISLHNDYCDRALDAQAKPWRAIPRGLIRPEAARWGSFALATTGLLAAIPLGLWTTVLVSLGTGGGFAYNAWLKRSGLTWMAFWVALPTVPLTAFAALDRLEPELWLVYVIGAPLVFGIYIADTLADLEADAALGVRGLAHRLGLWRARVLGWVSVGVAQALALLLWPAGQQPGGLFYLSVGLLCLAVAFGLFKAWRAHWPALMGSALALTLAWLAAVAR